MTGPCDFCFNHGTKIYRRVLMSPIVCEQTILVDAGLRSICETCLPEFKVHKSAEIVEAYRLKRLGKPEKRVD